MTDSSITIEVVDGMAYSIDGGVTWQTYTLPKSNTGIASMTIIGYDASPPRPSPWAIMR